MGNEVKRRSLFNFILDMSGTFLSFASDAFIRKPFVEWGLVHEKFNVGDRVKLNACPFDEQQMGEVLIWMFLKDKVQIVKTIRRINEQGSSGQWVKTDLFPDWIDAAWFDKVNDNE